MFSAQASQVSDSKLYVDDVFSTYLYTGNGSTQTITNGIDLAGKGGMVWSATRSPGGTDGNGPEIFDTARGGSKRILTPSTAGELTVWDPITFNSNGISLSPTTHTYINGTGLSKVLWTFRKAAKFFDVVPFTVSATTNTNQRISHSLGTTPGLIITKSLNYANSWIVWHRSLSSATDSYIVLDSTAAAGSSSGTWGTSAPTSTDFGINSSFFGNGTQHVAYVFAHDTSTDGIVQCGSVSCASGGVGNVTLPWESQFVLLKSATSTSAWTMHDVMRGMPVSGTNQVLVANTSAAEYADTGSTEARVTVNATGFTVNASHYDTYIYLAIRRPNKPPTSGAQVYNAIARTGTGAAATVTGVGFAPDLVHSFARTAGIQHLFFDRLRGATKKLYTSATDAEGTDAPSLIGFDSMDGVGLGLDNVYGGINFGTVNYINHFFKRAPGVFDVVCYRGNGATTNTYISHSLGVKPELMIWKVRSGVGNYSGWTVNYGPSESATLWGFSSGGLQSNSAASLRNYNIGTDKWTASSFEVYGSTLGYTNDNNVEYVTYLFATKAGISKVGSYTGNGSSQTINCGFTTGARFILIKRTDSTGDWKVIDAARGIIAGNDPTLALNSTAAEVTSTDCIDPDNSGFIVNQEATNNLNVNAATYIYLSFS